MIKRPALRYHGSKWRLAPWIIEQFPTHECYVEPYGGGGSVLLRKARSWLEVYNDLDGGVVNFFRMLRERTDDLVRVIDLTPFAKEEWELSFLYASDPLEMARRFYVRAWQNMAGVTTRWRGGWRRQKVITKVNGKRKMSTAAMTFGHTGHLHQVADRFKGVHIENDEALNVIVRYDSPETLFYVDPPYLASTRGRWKKSGYDCEMSDDQHKELAECLREIEGMAVVSGYLCDLYKELYAGWQRVEKVARVNGAREAVESLWLSPSCECARLPLFGWKMVDGEL